jgi:predicted HicB family RNase H-like nuclease
MIQAISHQPLSLDEVFEALKRPLALVPDPERREEIQRFLDAARVHQERAIFDLLSDVVARINESAGDVKVRLDYQARQFYLVVESTAPQEESSDPMLRMDGDLEKVTIRLPKALKEHIDRLAGERGHSLNSWYVRALAHEMQHQMRRGASDAGRESRFAWASRRGGRGRRSGRETD